VFNIYKFTKKTRYCPVLAIALLAWNKLVTWPEVLYNPGNGS